MEKLKRYIIFFIGLYINSLGVAWSQKQVLVHHQISSIPYVLSLNFPFTLGNFTIFFSLLLIFLQLLILRKNFKLEHVLQIPISILFGYFIDWSMILLGFVIVLLFDEDHLSADRMSDPWIWCVYRSPCQCCHASWGIFCTCHCNDIGIQNLVSQKSVLTYLWLWLPEFFPLYSQVS